MPKISLGKCSCYCLFPILYGIFVVVRMISFAEQFVPKHNTPINSTFISSISQLTLSLFIFVPSCSYSTMKPRVSRLIIPKERVNSSSNSSSIENYIIIFIIMFTNFCVSFVVFNYSEPVDVTDINLETEIRFIGILYVCYLCNKILKQRFLKQHILSIGIIVIFEVFLCCLNLIIYSRAKIEIEYKEVILSLLWLLFSDAYYSTKHVTEKWLMDTRGFEPFKLLLIEGIMSLLINLVIMVVFYFIPCPSYFNYCKDTNMFNISYFIEMFTNHYVFVLFFFICTCFVESCMTLTNKIYTPALRPIFDSMTTVVQLIRKYQSRDDINVIFDQSVFIIKLIIYGIIFIMCLLFNEVILLGCCGMEEERWRIDNQKDLNDYEDNEGRITGIFDTSKTSD